MPAAVSDVASGIAARLATISGMRTFAFDPMQYNPPVAFPILQNVRYHEAFAGGDVQMEFSVMVIAARWAERLSYAVLDGFMSYSGASSVRAAIEGDKTLGGVAQTCVLSSSANITSVSSGEAEFLSVEFVLTVHA